MFSCRATVLLVCSVAGMCPPVARAQGAAGQAVAPGTFVGRDSLDTREEPATASRVRSFVDGVATWAMEFDSLDLRRKFTIRLTIPAPSPVTIVLRAVDTLAPAPGRYGMMNPSSGASHGSRRTMRGDVYAREGTRERTYFPQTSQVVITSVSMESGQPVVAGHLDMPSDRYADGIPGQVVFPYVRLKIAGDFAARVAPDMRPRIAVTPAMQKAVLVRALDGFMITNMGAANGDGDADSTRQSALARQFLESRWRDAAVIERVDVHGMRYDLRLRGRLAPVVCEMRSDREGTECTTLPAPVSRIGAPARLSGRVAIELGPQTRGSRAAVVVHLLPNPAPLKDAFARWCANRDKAERIDEAAFEAKLSAARGDVARAAVERAYVSAFEKQVPRYRREYRALFASFATQHATAGVDGQYLFARVRPGNYLLFSALLADERIEWFLPIVVDDGAQLSHDLSASNVNTQGWSCGTPLPFAAVHEQQERF